MGLAPAFRLATMVGMVFLPTTGTKMPSALWEPGIALLPCRTFCEVLLDSCWTLLQESGLPVACHTLPEGPEPSQSCLTVSNHKGKTVMHLKLMPLVFYGVLSTVRDTGHVLSVSGCSALLSLCQGSDQHLVPGYTLTSRTFTYAHLLWCEVCICMRGSITCMHEY